MKRMVHVADVAVIEARMLARLAELPKRLAPKLARILASRGPHEGWGAERDAEWAELVTRETDEILRQAIAELHATGEPGGAGTA